MAATPIVMNQIRKITTFIYILVFLLIVNIVFILKYKWDVIPIIVNVYLFVFSFYLIFNFSLIDIPPLKAEYRKVYRGWGDAILFFKTRIMPIMIIYFITVMYTLINFLDRDNWPWNPLLELLDGRFSNTVFYSLILLIILKFNRRPKITLLLFVIGAAIYFLLYQLVFYFAPSGAVMSGLKFFQITVAFILLIYEFLADRFTVDKKKIRKSIGAGLLIGLMMYSLIVGTLVLFYNASRFASYPQARSAQILLRLGYSFPLKKFKDIVIETSDPFLLYDLIYYSTQNFSRPPTLSSSEWENLILSGSMEVANIIAYYINNENITLSYRQILSYAERRSIDNGESLINSAFYIRYTARYCDNHGDDFIERYSKGNRYFKIWIIRVLAESKCTSIIPFLISLLTDIDPALSSEAYTALSRITGLDPAKDGNTRQNDPAVMLQFNKFYLDSRSIR